MKSIKKHKKIKKTNLEAITQEKYDICKNCGVECLATDDGLCCECEILKCDGKL